jgi:hypothetical protein
MRRVVKARAHRDMSDVTSEVRSSLDLRSFKTSVEKAEPPIGLSLALQALWWDAKGDWEKAHQRAQERDDEAGMWVHAYLHRKEGDLSNADYWYRRCRKPPAKVSLEQEWESLAQTFLSQK